MFAPFSRHPLTTLTVDSTVVVTLWFAANKQNAVTTRSFSIPCQTAGVWECLWFWSLFKIQKVAQAFPFVHADKHVFLLYVMRFEQLELQCAKNQTYSQSAFFAWELSCGLVGCPLLPHDRLAGYSNLQNWYQFHFLTPKYLCPMNRKDCFFSMKNKYFCRFWTYDKNFIQI